MSGTLVDEDQTVEEQSKLNTAMKNIRARTKDLLLSVEQLERQRGMPSSQWLVASEQIARQFRSLSDQIAPMLDHWVFLPVENTDRLPELLRTKLEAEEEKREQELLKQVQAATVGSTDELQVRQRQTHESCGRLLEALNSNADAKQITQRKRTFAASRLANSSNSTSSGNNAKQQQLANAGGGAKLFSLLYARQPPGASSSSASNKTAVLPTMELETRF